MKCRKATYRTAANRVRNCNCKDTVRSGSVRTAWERKPFNGKTTRETKRKEMEKLYRLSRLHQKTDSHKVEKLKSRLPKQVNVNNTQLHRKVTVRKKMRRSYAEIVKSNISERRE